MTTIQLVTLPNAVVQPKVGDKTTPMAVAVAKLVDDLPDIVAANNIALGIESLFASEGYMIDVEHRLSGQSSNPADLRVVAMIMNDRPSPDEMLEVRHVWCDILNNWFWDNDWDPPEVVDVKLLFGC